MPEANRGEVWYADLGPVMGHESMGRVWLSRASCARTRRISG